MTSQKRNIKKCDLSWLKQLPQNWDVLPNRAIFKERDTRNTIDERLLSVTIKKGVIPQSTMIQQSSKKDSSNEDKSKYKLVLPGDIVYNKMRMWQGAVGYSNLRGIVSPAYIVLRSSRDIYPKYFHYLFRSPVYSKECHKYSHGICDDQMSLRFEDFKTITSILPPIEEQRAIVHFLDYKCAQINKFIQKKKRLIELLKEQRQVIINQAVTRGLDPNVRFKPSGVEWLGDIPEHWDIAALKHLAALKSGESITSLSIDEIGSYPVYGGNGIRGYTSSFTHQGLYPLIGRQGALCGNVHLAEGKFWASEHAVVVKPKINLSTIWLTYLLKVMNLNQYSESAAQPGLSVSKIQNLKVPFPSFNEQSAIADHIELKITPLESAITQINKQIYLIQEYRTRLISDVVTGQIDVRNIEISNVPENEHIEETLEEEQEEESLELIGAGDDD